MTRFASSLFCAVLMAAFSSAVLSAQATTGQSSARTSSDEERPQVGLGFWPHSAGIEVNSVTPGSAAAKAGIERGMIITHANGRELMGMSITEIEQYVGGLEGEITFKISGKGEVTLRKAPIPRRTN